MPSCERAEGMVSVEVVPSVCPFLTSPTRIPMERTEHRPALNKDSLPKSLHHILFSRPKETPGWRWERIKVSSYPLIAVLLT